MIEYQLKSPVLYSRLFAIRAKIYRIKTRLSAQICPSGEPIPFSSLETQTFSRVTHGVTYGRLHSCAWISIDGHVPEDAADPVLLLDMNGEALIYSKDGDVLGAVSGVWAGGDVRRSAGWRLVADVPDIKPGRDVSLRLDCGYNGFNFKDLGAGRFRGAYIAERNAEAYGYYYDYLTLLLLHSSTEDEDKKRALAKALRASFKRFSKDDVAGARQALARHLNAESDSEFTYSAIGHGHLDLAWMWPIRETMRKAQRTISIALRNLEKYPDFLFGTSQPQQLQWIKHQAPELYARIKQAVLDGRIEMQGGFWVECDCNVTGGESLVRQALYGKRFVREEFGSDMRMCWLPDAFGFNGNLPQILKGCGMDYFSTIKLSWNKTYKFPYRTFWWEGIDKTRVLVHMPPEGDYNSAAGPHNLLRGLRLYPERELGTALLVYGSGDGGGGPRESHLELIRREHSLAGLPRVRSSSAIGFFHKLVQRHVEHVWRGELYLDVHQGTYTTQGQNKRYNRLMERLLHEAEALAVLRSGSKPYPHAALEEIWKETLLYQFHDILPGSSIGRVYRESCAGYEKMEQRLSDMIGELLPPGDKPAAVNLTAFRRTQHVKYNDLWYHADVPPYASRELVPFGKADGLIASGGVLSNGILKLVFNRWGEIVSCKDRRGHELANGVLNRLTLYRDHFADPYNAWNIDPNYYKKPRRRLRAAEVKEEICGPLAVRTHVYCTGKSQITQRVILEAGSDTVRFETTVDWQESHRMLRADFYPADYADTAEFGIQFGAMSRSARESDGYGRSQFEVCGHKWACVRRAGKGFALLCDSKYGYRAKNGLLSLNLLRSPKFPDPKADRGTHTFTYAFCPVGENNARAVEEGCRLSCPLLVGGYAPFESIAHVRDAGVVLETVKQSEDGEAIVLRLYESLGSETRTAISTRISFECARFSDLLENAAEDANLADLHFNPYEIKTIRLEKGAIGID